MLIGSQNYISSVLKVISNIQSGMFLPLQEGAVEALSSPQSWFDKLNSIYDQRRTYAWGIFDELNCHYSKDQSLSDMILKKSRVFITPGLIFGSQGKKYLRISLCSNEEIFSEALKRIKHNISN